MIRGSLPLAMTCCVSTLLHTVESHRVSPIFLEAQAAPDPSEDNTEAGSVSEDDIVQPAASAPNTDVRHLLISKYLQHIDEKQWNRLLEESVSQGWDGEKLHFPLRGEVFLDGGWTPLIEKDWKYVYRGLKKGKKEFQIKSRKQKYIISVLSRTEGKQVNAASGKTRHLRFVYADSMELPKLDVLVNAAPTRPTAAQMCTKDGVGRRGSKFALDDNKEYKAYFACHDDKGNGIDLCFYNINTPRLQICRNSVGHLKNSFIRSTGEFELAFYHAFQGRKTILSGALIENATRFQNDTFTLTDTNSKGKEEIRTYSDIDSDEDNHDEQARGHDTLRPVTKEEESEEPVEEDGPDELIEGEQSADDSDSETEDDQSEDEMVDEDKEEAAPASASKRISSQIKVDLDAFKALKKSARWAMLEDLKANQVEPYKAQIGKTWEGIRAEDRNIKEEQHYIQGLEDKLAERQKAYEKMVSAVKKKHSKLRKMYKNIAELKKIAKYH